MIDHGVKIVFGDPRLPERFWEKVEPDPNGGCWLWVAGRNSAGYGQLASGKTKVLAHRLAYQALVSDIPISLQCDHLCRNIGCVYPGHVELVTPVENTRRGNGGLRNRVKTHCPRGHEYSEGNTYSHGGSRYCRSCQRKASRESKARMRARLKGDVEVQL